MWKKHRNTALAWAVERCLFTKLLLALFMRSVLIIYERQLREPPIEQFTQNGNDGREGPVDFSSGIMALPLVPVYLPAVSGLLAMHPEPKHIFKLWQIFAESVHPLIMIIHAPTVQRRISEVCWSLEAVPKPLEAVMFAVYALAISSMKEADCIRLFGETRSVLLNRYSTSTAQALAAANLHVTRDLDVLQALVLFILLDYRSDASVTLTGLAIRIGHKMGLHRTGIDSKTPFFEEEMARAHMVEDPLPGLALSSVELHPCMASRPAVEHTGATEMLYCLMKYEVAHWMRTSSTLAEYSANPLDMIRSTSLEGMTTKRKALAEIRQIYENKYIRFCDPTIPLHHLSATVGRLFIYRRVFSCLHPRNQPEGGRLMSQADQVEVFESSAQVLQLGYEVRRTPFSVRLLELQASKTQVDALVYMVSELRQRVSGDLVRTAWVLVERMYKDYPDLLQVDSKFSTGLADLTLEAWEVRRRELQRHREVAVPEFIGLLQTARGKARAYDGTLDQIGGVVPEEGTQIGFLHESLDWEFWNDFLEI
ncbi:transcriptional regulator family: Fungal Specific TF [Paecilomyces variotii]|nr:transcriptional regulator family: Fungal Specific TF [Paecilomyces variotii]